jgi:hypothetical protein
MRTRVRINPNLRLNGYLTVADLDEDVIGDIPTGGSFEVEVFEPLSGLSGYGYVVEVDTVERTVTVSVDWTALTVDLL